MPTVASTAATTSTNNFFTYLPALSSTDAASPFTVVSYLRLLTMPADYPSTSSFKSISRAKTSFIYASSTFQPQNVAENAILTQHDQVSFSFPSLERGGKIFFFPTELIFFPFVCLGSCCYHFRFEYTYLIRYYYCSWSSFISFWNSYCFSS